MDASTPVGPGPRSLSHLASPQQSTTEPIRAAGGVLWRTGASGDIEVVGVYRPSRDNWSLPKGKLEAGEHRADPDARAGERCGGG